MPRMPNPDDCSYSELAPEQLKLEYHRKYRLPARLGGGCDLDGVLAWHDDPGARPDDPAAFVERFGNEATNDVVRRLGLPSAWR